MLPKGAAETAGIVKNEMGVWGASPSGVRGGAPRRKNERFYGNFRASSQVLRVPSSDVARRSCAALHPVIYTRRGREALALTFSLALQSGTDGLVSLVRTVVIVCSARRPA